MARVVHPLLQHWCDFTGCRVCSGCDDIRCAQAFAALIVTALQLVRSRRSSPQKSIRKTLGQLLHSQFPPYKVD
ncbi:hypothetical protein D3C80_1908360 [compost metagenome]